MKPIFLYVLKRLYEEKTWYGIIMAAVAWHWFFSNTSTEDAIGIATGCTGIVKAMFPEKK